MIGSRVCLQQPGSRVRTPTPERIADVGMVWGPWRFPKVSGVLARWLCRHPRDSVTRVSHWPG